MTKSRGNAKTIYVASLVLLTGLIYLAAQTDALFSIGSTRVKGDVIELSKNEMLSHFRSLLTIVLCFTGGVLLLKTRTAGWIICHSVLLLLSTIAIGIFISNVSSLNISGVLLIIVIVLLLSAIFLLNMVGTRRKFMVSFRSYVSVIVLFIALALFYFLLQ